MSKPSNGKSPTGPLRTTAGASRPLANGTAKTTTGTTKATNTTTGAKKPTTTPLAARAVPAGAGARVGATGTVREVRDTTAPRLGGKNAARRAQEARQEQARKLAPLFAVLGIVLVAVIVFVILANNNGSSTATPSTVNQVLGKVTKVSPSVYDSVKTGGVKNPFQKIPNGPALVNSKGLPIVLYVGGQYCPYCAAERWSLATAFSRFGTFSGVGLIQSSESSISTLDFYKSTYTSKYIEFQPVESQDQSHNQLQALTPQQQALFTLYDSPPYAQTAGGIPFVDYGNQFLTISSGYDPSVIQGTTWAEIANALSDPNNPMTISIIGNANYLTAGICSLTKDQPANVCGTTTIQDIEKTIKG